MKSLTVFAAVLAVAAAASYNPLSTWTLQEIDVALQDPATNPTKIPYLIAGLNALMASLHSGNSNSVTVAISMPYEEAVTLNELMAALHDPNAHPAVLPYYEQALKELMVSMNNGQVEDSIVLSIPAMNVNMWTLDQLSAAIQNPETDPELLIYLEHALNQFMSDLFAGVQASAIAVITPPGVIASVPKPVVPETAVEPELPVAPVVPVQPEAEKPVKPEAVAEKPVKPEAVAEKPTPVAASAPLVQLIVNVNANQASTPVVPKPTPVVDQVTPPIAVNPAGWNPEPIPETPITPPIAVNPAGWNPEPIQETPVIAVNPAGWSPETPVIAVGPWA